MLGTTATTCSYRYAYTTHICTNIMPSYSLHTLYRFYLLQKDGIVIERPQFLFMRIAVAIHGTDLRRVLETYELLSSRAYTPATPVLYNAGTNLQHMASCFIYQPPVDNTLAVLEDSVARLDSYWAADGGIGMNLGYIPAREYVYRSLRRCCADKPSPVIRSRSSGPVPLLDVYNSHARFLSLNRSRRSSSLTAYLPVWHADIVPFIAACTHRSSLPAGLKHIFPALWVPDILYSSLSGLLSTVHMLTRVHCSMQRLRDNRPWSLFDPVDVPSLHDLTGSAFTAAYAEYEMSGLAVQQCDVNAIWSAIVASQRETGTPFVLFQDNINGAHSSG